MRYITHILGTALDKDGNVLWRVRALLVQLPDGSWSEQARRTEYAS